ncbi:MAG: hypothetical protein Q9218_006966 [Villophora microphyllina]
MTLRRLTPPPRPPRASFSSDKEEWAARSPLHTHNMLAAHPSHTRITHSGSWYWSSGSGQPGPLPNSGLMTPTTATGANLELVNADLKKDYLATDRKTKAQYKASLAATAQSESPANAKKRKQPEATNNINVNINFGNWCRRGVTERSEKRKWSNKVKTSLRDGVARGANDRQRNQLEVGPLRHSLRF